MKKITRFLYIGLPIVCLGGLIFLWLAISASQESESRAAHLQPDTHAHRHPHDTHTHASPGAADVSNTEDRKGTPESPVGVMDSQGIRAAFTPSMELWQTDPEQASVELHAIAKQLGDGDPKWTEFYHLLGHSVVERPPGAPEGGAYLRLEDAERYFRLKNELMGLTDEDETHLKTLLMQLQ